MPAPRRTAVRLVTLVCASAVFLGLAEPARAELCKGFSPFEIGDGTPEGTLYLVWDNPLNLFRPSLYDESNGIYVRGGRSEENLQRGGLGVILGNTDPCAWDGETRPPDQLII